jgi:putative colanic acid biosynthesis UDP-glucose lipid carrier transferase
MLPKGLLKEYSQAIATAIRVFDATAVVAAGVVAYFFRFGYQQPPQEYMIALAIAAVLTLVIFSLFHIYESARALTVWRYLGRFVQAVLVVLLALAGLAFLTKTGGDFSRGWFIAWAVFSLVLLLLFRGSVLLALRIMRSRGWNERRVIIIGTGGLTRQLLTAVQQALWTGYRVTAIVGDSAQADREVLGIPVVPAPESIKEIIKDIDEIWLALPWQAQTKIKAILHELRHETVTTRLVLDIFDRDFGALNHSITWLAGFPVINVRATPMVGINRLLKAMEDRLLSMMILLITSPLFLLIALAVRFTSRGSVFYRQERVSWNGKEFSMLKFRTMPVDVEEKTGPVWAKKDDNRATRVGALLRKTSLDELPQFINVLRGDMSIVGPRPERKVFVEQFKDKVPNYMQKHLVKAGITGWAQVNGWRGNTSLEKRIEYDLYYIEHWSLGLDLKIIFLTLFRGLMSKNAY